MVLVVSVTAFGTAALYGALFNDASTTADARVLAALVTVGVGVLYEVWLIAVKGQTVGKLAVGIEVRRADVGELPGWDSSVRRCLLSGYLMRLVGRLRRVLSPFQRRSQRRPGSGALTILTR